MRVITFFPCSDQTHIALKAAGEGDEMAVLSFLDAGGDANAKGKTGSRCGNPLQCCTYRSLG